MRTKILVTIIYFATIATYALAQAPGFNYQAVLRDAQGEVLPNASITLYVSLTEGPDGPVLYKENHKLQTNELGILNTVIGTGTSESGEFTSIIGLENLNIKLEADLPGEPNVVDIGNSSVNATPYALYGRDEDSDPGNEMQTLSLEGDSLKISGTPGVSLVDIKSPWEYNADSNSYFLSFSEEGGQRNNERDGVEFKYLNGKVIQANYVNGIMDAVFVLKNQNMIEDFPLPIRKAYNRMLFYIHEEFGIDISPVDLEIDGTFTARDNFVRDFKIYAKLNDANNTKIWLQNNALFGDLEMIFFDDTRIVKLFGTIDEDCSAFELYMGSSDVLGVKEFFVTVNGERKPFSDNIVNQHFKNTEGNPTTPALHFTKSDEDGSTSWSMFSSNESNDCYHVNATTQGVENILYGNTNDIIARLFADDNAGWLLNGTGCSAQGDCKNILLVNESGQRSAPFASSLLSSNSDLSGVLQLNGTQSGNLQLTSLSGFPNNGYLLVLDKESQNKAGIFINDQDQGVVYGSNISAVVNEDGQGSTIYGALVGDESAAYTRGTAKLENGEAVVICPDHFQNIADPNSMTVTITPLSAKSKGVAVVEKFSGGFKVQELGEGSGTYDFDYMVSCKRKGFEKTPVQRKIPASNYLRREEIQSLINHSQPKKTP